MSAWRQGEVHLLVKEQESAVKAVRLERLVGSIGRPRHKKDKEIVTDEIDQFLTLHYLSSASYQKLIECLIDSSMFLSLKSKSDPVTVCSENKR